MAGSGGHCVVDSGVEMGWPGLGTEGLVWAAKAGTDGGNVGISKRLVEGVVGKIWCESGTP